MGKLRVVGINFDHFHMGDLLAMAYKHGDVEVVGICDERPERMSEVIQKFQIPDQHVFTDCQRCLEQTQPDLVILCPAAAKHGEWTERVARFATHILVEKPFAASLAEADRMIQAVLSSALTSPGHVAEPPIIPQADGIAEFFRILEYAVSCEHFLRVIELGVKTHQRIPGGRNTHESDIGVFVFRPFVDVGLHVVAVRAAVPK